MSRAAILRFAVFTAVAAAATYLVRALRGPAAPVFSTPPDTTGLLAPPQGDRRTDDRSDDNPTPTPPQSDRATEPAPEPADVEGDDHKGEPARPNPAGERWVFPVEGECPPSHPIKAKLRSGIYHLPGMMAYDRARPDRCYSTEVDAQADGLRRAKR